MIQSLSEGLTPLWSVPNYSNRDQPLYWNWVQKRTEKNSDQGGIWTHLKRQLKFGIKENDKVQISTV